MPATRVEMKHHLKAILPENVSWVDNNEKGPVIILVNRYKNKLLGENIDWPLSRCPVCYILSLIKLKISEKMSREYVDRGCRAVLLL